MRGTFLVEIFQKVPRNALSTFFSKICQEVENQFGRPKKIDKFFKTFFENPPPPRENLRFAPDYNNNN